MFKMNEIGRETPVLVGHMYDEVHPVKVFSLLVMEMTRRTEMAAPEVCVTPDGKGMRVLFMGMSVDVGDFLLDFGALFGSVSTLITLSVNGLTDHCGEGLLRFILREEACFCQKSSSSGGDFDVLSQIYLRLDFEDVPQAAFFRELLANLRGGYALAMPRQWDALALTNGLYARSDVSFYRYLLLEGGPERLNSCAPDALTLPQMVTLWQNYLENGAPWIEFEQAENLLESEGLSAVYRWQVALKIALENCGIFVTAENSRFRAEDALGRPLQLTIGYNAVDGAQRLMARLIYPA